MSEQVTGSGSGGQRRGKKNPANRTTTRSSARTTAGGTAGAARTGATSGTTSGSGDDGGTSSSAAAKLFDLRVMIGALFTFYGIVLIIAGFFASAAERKKAAGININLWQGIGMLILGLLFLLWWKARPLVIDPNPDEQGGPPPQGGH